VRLVNRVWSRLEQEGQGEVQALDLAVPAFLPGGVAAGGQVGLDLVEPGHHPGVDVQDGAADAGVLVLAGGAVGTAAGADLDFALIEW
jgi:hypothetical protein